MSCFTKKIPTWAGLLIIVAVLALLVVIAIPGFHHPVSIPNEKSAISWMREMVSTEALWKAKDLDRNDIADYWVADVSGMYRIERPGAVAGIPLAELASQVDVARADTKPFMPQGGLYFQNESHAVNLLPTVPTLFEKDSPPRAKAGYLFAALETDENGNAYIPAKDTDGKGMNANNLNKFGFVAYPEVYQLSGVNTLIVNEAGTVWKKDMEGKAVTAFPKDPEKEGWTPYE